VPIIKTASRSLQSRLQLQQAAERLNMLQSQWTDGLERIMKRIESVETYIGKRDPAAF
jgi:predicted proteasome-type protease